MFIRLIAFLFLIPFACSNAPQQREPLNRPDSTENLVNQPVPVEKAEPEKTNQVTQIQAEQPKPAAVKMREADKNSGQKTAEAVEPKAEQSPVSKKVISAETDHISHLTLDSLLRKHVSDAGKVNYKNLKADKAILDGYCQMLSDHPAQDGWSRAEKMAYWINAYNAYTLKLIVDNYPTKSILNFDGGKTWDVRRIRIGDKKYSLNNIENDVLRPVFKDPRVHFAINCAAKSCPPLWNRAYTAENLEATLESRARAFINNAGFNTVTSSRVQVSKIFEWYGADFGNLRTFLSQYTSVQLNERTDIRFNEYDWNLNE